MASQPSRESSNQEVADRRFQRDPSRPCFVISVAAGIVQAHPRTLRIYEDEGLLAPARTPTNIRLYSENDIRRILWIRRLTQERGVNLAGVRLLFELEERLGTRLLEALFDEEKAREAGAAAAAARQPSSEANSSESTDAQRRRAAEAPIDEDQYTSKTDGYLGSEDGRNGGRVFASEPPIRKPITRIVATRVTTPRSGDTND
jgi:MerR family transcriptional regulator/heat shock protein HspR